MFILYILFSVVKLNGKSLTVSTSIVILKKVVSLEEMKEVKFR